LLKIPSCLSLPAGRPACRRAGADRSVRFLLKLLRICPEGCGKAILMEIQIMNKAQTNHGFKFLPVSLLHLKLWIFTLS